MDFVTPPQLRLFQHTGTAFAVIEHLDKIRHVEAGLFGDVDQYIARQPMFRPSAKKARRTRRS
jgi:hypothetical protein